MIHACKGMLVECSTQLFLAQFNGDFQFPLKENMRYAKQNPQSIYRDEKWAARSKQCF